MTRPGFIRGIQALAASDAAVPALSSIGTGARASATGPYDPNLTFDGNVVG